VLRENLRVATTNRDGVALVPGLLPYESNLVSIDVDRLDASVLLDEESSYVSVTRNGVAVVAFDVREVRGVQALLAMDDGGEQRRLSYGEAIVEDRDARSIIGRDGQVYFEALPPGRHVLSAASGGIAYVCVLEIPEEAGMAWLGEVPCSPH
jgi:outer membrane usher protein